MKRFDDSFLDDLRARVPISQVVGTRVTFDRKKTNAGRGDWWACCPIHGEKSPSFHCLDKRGRYHCFGCGASGDHFRFLTDVDGMSFPHAVEVVAAMAGMSMPNAGPETEEEKREKEKRRRQRDAAEARRAEQERAEAARRTNSARGIWKGSGPLGGSAAAAYLAWRGLSPSNEEDLRCHSALQAPGGRTYPALIARVCDATGQGAGVWRIFLDQKGAGKAPIETPKLGLGPTAGGAIRLGGVAAKIGIAEGVETALAVRELGTPFPVWSVMSTSGMIGFQIPAGVEEVVVFPDGDREKIRTKHRPDGTPYVAKASGMEAARRFVENNPGRKITIAGAPAAGDFLELLQKMKGLPVR